MAEKDDVKFDNAENNSRGEEAERAEQAALQADAAGEDAEPISPKTSSSSNRLLVLLILLLLLLGGAAWFFFLSPAMDSAIGKEPVNSSSPRKQGIPIPARQEDKAEKAQPQKQPPSDKNSEAPQSPEKAPETAAKPPESKSAAKAVTEKPAAPETKANTEARGGSIASGPVPQKPASRTAEGSPTPAKTAPAAEEKTPTPPKPAPAAQGPKGAYTVQVGAYTTSAHLNEAQNELRSLGFDPYVKESHIKKDMVRLRVGTFFPSQGEAKMAEISDAGGKPFFTKDGDLMVVYAGSFKSEKSAERFARKLQERGIHVEAETLVTKVPLSILRFGSFTSFAEAKSAAAQVRDSGLDVLIVKSR